MRRILKSYFIIIFAALVIIGVCVSIVVMQQGKSAGAATLQITEQDRANGPDKQPAPQTEIKKVKVGGTVTVTWANDFKAVIMIKSIRDDTVSVQFNTKSIVKQSADGTIDLNAYNYNWADEINYNEGYTIGTQTKGTGAIWTLLFKK